MLRAPRARSHNRDPPPRLIISFIVMLKNSFRVLGPKNHSFAMKCPRQLSLLHHPRHHFHSSPPISGFVRGSTGVPVIPQKVPAEPLALETPGYTMAHRSFPSRLLSLVPGHPIIPQTRGIKWTP